MKIVIFRLLPLSIALILAASTYSLTTNEKSQKSLFHLLKVKWSDKPKTQYQNQQQNTIVNDVLSNNQVNTTVNSDNSVEIGGANSNNFSGWLSISSELFKNPTRYPPLKPIAVELTPDGKRKNPNSFIAQKDGAKTISDFWFILGNGYLYYYSLKNETNILDSILIRSVSNETRDCFSIINYSDELYHICTSDHEVKLKFLCEIQTQLKTHLDFECPGAEMNQTQENAAVVVEKKKKRIIIFPTASRHCNERWDYKNKGTDWECTCIEGNYQSPINLPDTKSAVANKTVPHFIYTPVKSVDMTSTNEDNTILRYENGVLKLKNKNKHFGEIILQDGGIYHAKEIIFHTPSEHTINNKRYDMEMQIIHEGVSKGDISKQVVLSFLFRSQPGVTNKFFSNINFLNLPNKIDQVRVIDNNVDLYIPDIFLEENEQRLGVMPAFSLYTYNGSLSLPPCTERTVVLVASEPIPLSSVVFGMFKEALNAPDLCDELTGEVYTNTEEKVEQNYREIQPINGRTVFYYDNELYGYPGIRKKKVNKKFFGHYEKRLVHSQDIFYVSGKEPSGIPGAFVIENENHEFLK